MTEPVKISINDTPTQQVIAKAKAPIVIHDSNGRAITLKKPGILAQYRLVEALGEAAKNQVYMTMVLPLIFVAEIDGDPIFALSKKSDVEALIQRLDDEGVAAVMTSVHENFGPADPEADKAEIKN